MLLGALINIGEQIWQICYDVHIFPGLSKTYAVVDSDRPHTCFIRLLFLEQDKINFEVQCEICRLILCSFCQNERNYSSSTKQYLTALNTSVRLFCSFLNLRLLHLGYLIIISP